MTARKIIYENDDMRVTRGIQTFSRGMVSGQFLSLRVSIFFWSILSLSKLFSCQNF